MLFSTSPAAANCLVQPCSCAASSMASAGLPHAPAQSPVYGPHPRQAPCRHCGAEKSRRDRRSQRFRPQAMDQAQRLAFGVIPNCRAAAGSEGWRWRQDALLTTLRDLSDVMRTVSTFADPGWRRSAFDGPLLHDAHKLARRERGRCDQRSAFHQDIGDGDARAAPKRRACE